MKNVLYCIFLCLPSFLIGQDQSGLKDFHEKYIAKAKAALAEEEPDYRTAINYLIIARQDPTTNKPLPEVDDFINTTLNKWVAEEQRLREEADTSAAKALLSAEEAEESAILAKEQEQEATKQKKSAEFRRELLYSYFVAEAALENIEQDSLDTALQAAYHAYYKPYEIDTLPMPSKVRETWGAAVFVNFIDTLAYTHTGGIKDFHFSESKTLLYAIGRDKKLSIWTYKEGKFDLLDISSKASDYILSADFSPDGSKIVYGTKNGKAWIWPSMDSLKCDTAITQIKWISNEQFLTGDRAGKVRLWDAKGKQLTSLVKGNEPLVEIQLSDNKTYALARTAKALYYWENKDTTKVAPLLRVSKDTIIYTAALASDGKMLLISDSGNGMRLWRNDKFDRIVSSNAVLSMCLSADDKRCLLGSNSNVLQWIELDTVDYHQYNRQNAHRKQVDKVFFSPKRMQAFSTSFDYNINIGLGEGNMLLPAHRAIINHISFPALGDTVFVSSSDDKTAKLWTMEGDLLMNMVFDSKVVKTLFTKDENYMLVGTAAGRLYAVPTPRYVYEQAYKEGFKITKGKQDDIAIEMNKKIEELLNVGK